MRNGFMRWFSLLGGVGILSAMMGTVALATDMAQPAFQFVVPMGADGIQRVTIILDSYSYTPNHVIVEAGKPVELTLTSVTMITPHNFIIKELSVEQDVSAGKTVVIMFTPTQTGVFPIYCDKRLWPLPSHRDKGMEGQFEVK